MYIIEFIIKKWFSKKPEEPPVNLEPSEDDSELYQNCDNHLYIAIDSTCDFLACKNCGHIIRNTKKDKIDKDFYNQADNF